MEITSLVPVLDAADVAQESAFWAGVLGGEVNAHDESWHVVMVGEDERLCVQHAPDHQPPDWPHGTPQQIHFDLVVPELGPAHTEVTGLGARLLQAAEDPAAEHGFQVYADPAGHPFCLCW